MFAEIRSWWEVPCIAHFCSLFRAAFGLTDFEIEDLEDALAIDGAVEDSHFLADLQARLLRGIYGKKHDINPENFELYLSELVRVRWEEELGKENPLKDTQYKSLLPRDKVEILHSLCDWRLDSDDVSELLKGLEADSLRVEALGYDAQGHTYWYFYGTRLYKEEKTTIEPVKKEKKKKVKAKKRKKKIKKKKQKKKAKKKKQSGSESDFETSSDESSEFETSEDNDSEEEDQSVTENDEESPKCEVKWSLVCSTAEEWEQLAEVFKKSKNRDEKALFQTLTVDFLPEIEKMIEAKEKAAKKKFLLEMAPRRQSDRIALKTQGRDDDDEPEDEEEREKDTEEKRKEDEANEKEREKLAEKRKTERAERARLREERQWMIASGELPPEVATALAQNAEIPASIEGKPKKRSADDDEMDRDEDLYTGLYKVLDAAKKHHNAWPFLEPVDESYAPQYFDIVESPMDLSSMEEKLDDSKYKSLSEFVEDFKLMLNNCLEYNGPDSMYTKMSHSLEAAFTRLVAKHFPEDEDQDDWDFEEEFSKSKRKKKKFNRKGLKSIDDYVSGAPKMCFDPTSKMFVPESERRDLPQRPNNLPLPMFNNMAMGRMPNGGMFPSQHPNMQFHPGNQAQFGNRPMYSHQLYQNSMPPQFAYGFGNPAQMGQMRQMNPRNMPPNFHPQAMRYPGMAGQQVMGQHQMQGGAQPLGVNQDQIPGQRMPLSVGQGQLPRLPGMPNQGQLPGQPGMSNQGQLPGQPGMSNQGQLPGQPGMPNQGQPIAPNGGAEQGQAPGPNQGQLPMTSQAQPGMPQMQPSQGLKANPGQVSSSVGQVQSPSVSQVSSPAVGAAQSPAVQQDEDKAKEVTSPSSTLSPIATSGEPTPPSWTTGSSKESVAAQPQQSQQQQQPQQQQQQQHPQQPQQQQQQQQQQQHPQQQQQHPQQQQQQQHPQQQHPGQMPHNYMQHPAYAQMQQNQYYASKNPAYRHPMAAYGGPRGGPRQAWDPSMGQFPRQFQQHMRPQDPSVMQQQNPGQQDLGRSIDLTQSRFPGNMQQMASPSQTQNTLATQSSTPTRSEDSPTHSDSDDSSQADKMETPVAQQNTHAQGMKPDQRQYPAVVPERELASMRQGIMASTKQTTQFMEQQRARMHPSPSSFMHSNPLFAQGDQPLRRLEEMAFSKDGGPTRQRIMSPEHQQDDRSRQQTQAATNIQGSPASNASPAEPDFPFLMGRNGQHQGSKEHQGETDSLQDNPNSSPHERNSGRRESMLQFARSPEHLGSNKPNLMPNARGGNTNINGAQPMIRSNGSSQHGDEATMQKEKNDTPRRPDMMQAQNYMMGNPSIAVSQGYTNHSIAARLTGDKERTMQENPNKGEETPSSRSNSMINYLKELSRNPLGPANLHKAQTEQTPNSSIDTSDKSRDAARLRPPPPLQMESGDPLHLGFPYQSPIAGGQAEFLNRQRQMSGPLPGQQAKPQGDDHTRSFGSAMFIDLEQRQPSNQSLMNLDKGVHYHHPQSLYSPQQQEALRRQQMFMLQRQMQVQEMAPYMSSQMAAAQPGRTAMDYSMLQQQQFLNAYGRHMGRNGEFPTGFSAHDMSATKPRFS